MTSEANSGNITGLVVSATDSGEADKLATLITADGRFFARFRGVRNQKAKLKALVQPFCLVELSVARGQTVTGGRVLDSHQGIFADLKRFAAASVILEAASKIAENGGDFEEEFPLTLTALKTAEQLQTFPMSVTLWYLLKLMSMTGADWSDYPIPQKTASAFQSISVLSPSELDAWEGSESDVISALSYVDEIFKNAFQIYLKSMPQAIKLCGRRNI